MRLAVAVLEHTPPWVFAVLALLIWLGVRRMGLRTMATSRVWITPAVFLILSVAGALARRQPPEATVLAWLCGAALGAGPGVFTAPRHVEVDRAHRLVRFGGSIFPLARNLMIFSAQYGLAVAAALGGRGVAIWAIGVSGAAAGYFIGWSGMFLARLQRAPETSLSAQPA